MEAVEIGPELRAFLTRIVPREAKIQSLQVGPYEFTISYITPGGKHRKHVIAKWVLGSERDAD